MTPDTATLIIARGVLRDAYARLYALPQDEPAVRCLITELSTMAHDLTVEIDADEPELAL
jgi:hypothetical protein